MPIPLQRFIIILILFAFAATPAQGANLSEFVPAPEVELKAPDPKDIQREIDRLTRRIRRERPANYSTVRNWLVQTGNNIGAGGDYLTASWAMAGQSLPKALDDALEKFGIVFAVTTCLEKQFVSGEPAGLDAAYETAKFLTGKIAGGGYAAAVGVLKYSLDTFGNSAKAQIDSDFYRNYADYQLQEHPDFRFYFDSYAQPEGGVKVEEALDRFWDDPRAAGIRGYHFLLETSYKGDLKNVKFAYRQKFLKEYVYKALVEIWQDKLLDAEVALELECRRLYNRSKTKPKVRIGIKSIIDRGTAKGARNVKATLTHSGKYIVAQKAVSGTGVGFEVSAGKLINPESLKPVARVQVILEPTSGAQFMHGTKTITIELEGDKPRIEKSAGSDKFTAVLNRPVFVQLLYPITVNIGGPNAVTRVSAQVVAGKPRYHSSSSPWSRQASKKGGAFVFEKMPTGKCTFSYGDRRVTKMITRKEEIVLEAPGAVSLEAKAPMVNKPDLAALNTQRVQALAQQKNFDKFEADVKTAIGQVAARMTAAYADYAARYEAALTTIKEQQRLLRKQKDMAYEQKEALKQELDQKRKALSDEHSRVRKDFSTLNKQYSNAQRQISKEIQQEDRAIKDDQQQDRNEMSAELKKVKELETQINDALRQAAHEINYSGLAYKNQAEGEAAITELEQKIARIEKMVQQIQVSVEKSNELRQRFESRWDVLEKRRISREQNAPSLPRIMTDVDQMKLLLDSLKRNAVAEKSKKVSKSIAKRHAQRKKNAAEFAKLLNEIKTQGTDLPEVAVKDFARIYQQTAEQFAGVIDDPQRSPRDAKKVLAGVSAFLDRNEVVIGDLRTTQPDPDNGYIKIERLIKKASDMVSEGLVYAGPDYYKAWEPFQSKLMDAGSVRHSTGLYLVALERDLQKAAAGLGNYRQQVTAASTEAQRLIAAATARSGAKAADVGGVLDLLDKAWAQAGLLPVFRRNDVRLQISAVADDLAVSGALVRYAKTARRPLVVFDSYAEAGDFKKEKKINKAIFRTRPGAGPYTSISFKAHVVGLPPGKASLVAVENDWWRYVCHRDQKTGKHFIHVTLMDGSMPRIRVLGTGDSNPPIDYPFFRQVAFL